MKLYFENTDEIKMTAIVIVPDPTAPKGIAGKKYRGVDNSNAGVTTFTATMKRKFPSATHCNFYGKERGYFIDRVEME